MNDVPWLPKLNISHENTNEKSTKLVMVMVPGRRKRAAARPTPIVAAGFSLDFFNSSAGKINLN